MKEAEGNRAGKEMLPDGEERVAERDQRLFPSRLPKWARMPEAIPSANACRYVGIARLAASYAFEQ